MKAFFSHLASLYFVKNSIDVAWDELMSPRFDTLRKFIFGTQGELLRFRQLIVNVVMATDIFDKEINDRRKERWARAFNPPEGASKEEVNDLRGTIVIEHIVSLLGYHSMSFMTLPFCFYFPLHSSKFISPLRLHLSTRSKLVMSVTRCNIG